MIEVVNISRSWGAFRLRKVSLVVRPGEYMVVLGPCGSGKTLLLETLAGLHQPESGRILIDGQDVTRLPPERRRVGLVYQQYALFPHLSVRANIGYGLRYLRINRAERRRRIQEMIDLFDIGYLADRRTPRGLSGGESQKVALARALAVHPVVLLLDEPFSSLDQQVRRKLLDTLPQIIRDRQVPVIHVTHDYTEAAALADSIAIMHNGRLVQSGPAAEVFRKPATRFTAEFLGIGNIVAVDGFRKEGDCAVVRCGDLDLLVRDASPLESDWSVSLAVSEQDIRLFPAAESPPSQNAEPPRENLIEGGVTTLRFDAAGALVGVEAGGVHWTVRTCSSDPLASRLRPGDSVRLHFPPDALHIVMEAVPAAESETDTTACFRSASGPRRLQAATRE